MDDLKISHKMRHVVDTIIDIFEKQYGKIVVTHRSKRMCVRMEIEFTNNGEEKILMTEYLKEAIKAFPEDCSKTTKRPAASSTFEVNKTCAKLIKPNRKTCHSIVADKLLFVSGRARPDSKIHFPYLVRFLKQLLQYLFVTLNIPLTVSIDNMNILKTWEDAAYALHGNVHSHTGSAIVMGNPPNIL